MRARNIAFRFPVTIIAGRDKPMVVTITELQRDKTLKQLGALFGLWVKEEAERMGESEDHVHKKWKAMFLARIYATNPIGDQQEQFVELMYENQSQGKLDKLMKHAERISLSWARANQMAEYLKSIEEHYIAEGMPLTVPDPMYRFYKGQR